MGLYSENLRERFNREVELVPFSGCHYWMGRLNDSGYGVLSVGKRDVRAHRLAYELAKGEIPALETGKPAHILHSCDNPLCVNPDHLRPGSHADNMADAALRKRMPRRLKHHWGVYPDEVLDAVCLAIIRGDGNSTITRTHQISAAHVSAIRHGAKELERFTALGGVPMTGRMDRPLSDAAARAIYDASGTLSEVAIKFGTSPATVRDIRLGKSYFDVTGARD